MIECPDCTANQQYVLEQLQVNAGVTDKTALAVLMGNIQQESNFKPNDAKVVQSFLTMHAYVVVMV